MDSRNKKPLGISIVITIVSLAVCSVSIYLVKNLNITINANTKDDEKVVEATSTPTTSPPVETNSTEATTALEQTNTPTNTPTNSPTEQPTLTVETTDNTKKINEKDLEKYCLDSSDTKEPDNKDNAEKDNTAQTTNENNQEKTIDIKETSQIVIATNPEQVDDDSNIMTISHSKRTVRTITQDNDTENKTTVTNTPENTASPESDENIGEDGNTPNSSEDLEPTDQTFSLNEICNYNFSETNYNGNIKYINVEPGEYTFTLNNSSIEINYYVIPNIDSLFTDSEETTAPNDSEEEPLYDENQETE